MCIATCVRECTHMHTSLWRTEVAVTMMVLLLCLSDTDRSNLALRLALGTSFSFSKAGITGGLPCHLAGSGDLSSSSQAVGQVLKPRSPSPETRSFILLLLKATELIKLSLSHIH